MKFIIVKFALIFILTFFLRIVELCRDVVLSLKGDRRLPDVKVIYNAAYLHLPMSMASVGLICDKLIAANVVSTYVLPLLLIFLLTIIGCISRGMFSKNSPEVMSFSDTDWLFGIVIPNALGTASLLISITGFNFI